MNYSRNMRENYKRLFITWLITIILTAIISSSITALVIKPEAQAIETSEEYFFTQEVQQPEQIPAALIGQAEPATEDLGEYNITAYCACEKCCGSWAKDRPDGIVYGAAMVELEEGVSVAAPKDLPFGTKIIIEGLGEYVVQDRPATWIAEKYDNKVIDIYFENHEDAQNFGLQHKKISIVKGEIEDDQM